jgi:hypothetical protein
VDGWPPLHQLPLVYYPTRSRRGDRAGYRDSCGCGILPSKAEAFTPARIVQPIHAIELRVEENLNSGNILSSLQALSRITPVKSISVYESNPLGRKTGCSDK